MIRARELPARIRVMPAVAALSVALSGAASGVAAAQPVTGDTLPFRRGQWATQFSLGHSAAGLGLLRFGSPTRAWLLDAEVFGRYVQSEGNLLPGGSGETAYTDGFALLRLGPRRYRSVVHDVAGFAGWGLLGSASWGWRDEPHTVQRRISAGSYAEFGATYLVTRRLSLGASAQLRVDYSNGRWESTSQITGEKQIIRDWAIGWHFTPARLAGTIYF